ncbi:hypothetical protein [Staphylococcus sp. GDB9P120P]|uniref:hypothetical protein n=1 Tax=Staphylococcus sp. GDB9P120P TaxID=2804084 RepID=UPI001AEC383E|nr:hypothetical protein [Staphylococcus sp. GDB9P120P]
MSIMNIVMITIGTIIIVSAFVIILTSIILEIILNVKKRKSKTLIPTEIEGQYEVKYNVSEKLLSISELFSNYKSFAKIGFLFGVGCISVPLLQMLLIHYHIPPK